MASTILQDGFRSPGVLTNNAGSVTDKLRYSATGQRQVTMGSFVLSFGYGGYLIQPQTDELYAFARTYSPGLGRFNEVDPVRGWDPMMAIGAHRYTLGYGNSLKFVDPDGRFAAAGHYYTVLLAADAAGFSRNRAPKMALYAQLPDEIASLDAITQVTNTVMGTNSQDVYRWRGGMVIPKVYIGSYSTAGERVTVANLI